MTIVGLPLLAGALMIMASRRIRWPTALAVALAILDVGNLRWIAWSELSALTLSEAVSIVGWVLLSGTAYCASWSAYRKTQRPLHRNRLRYWMLIMVFVLVGDGLFILSGFPYGELGTLLHWFGVALASIALLSHHLPDLSGVVRQSLKYVLLTSLTALVFAGGIFGARVAIPLLSGAQAALLGTVGVGLVLAIVYPILRRWIQQLLDRLLFGEGYDR